MELWLPVSVFRRRPLVFPLPGVAISQPAIARTGCARVDIKRSSRLRALVLGLGVASCVLTGTAAAQSSVVIYRCTDADGMVSLQNDVPCPKASRQERRVIDTVAPTTPPARPTTPAPAVLPARTPAAALTSAEGAPSAAPTTRRAGASADADASEINADHPVPDTAAAHNGLLPPPPLFSCRTWEREDFLTDDEVPAQRCAPLRITGLGGAAEGGAGLACQTVRDTCTPVPEPALCAQWQQYVHDRQAVLTFGRAANPAHARAELERVSAIFRRSHCPG